MLRRCAKMKSLLLAAYSCFFLSVLHAELENEELSSRISQFEGKFYLETESAKTDTTLPKLGSYWCVRFVSFYEGGNFLGSYLIFSGPNKSLTKKSEVRVPTSIKDYDRLVVKENYWRLLTGSSADPRLLEERFAKVWNAKSSVLPATEKQLFHGTDPKRLFLTDISDLPDYYPWLRRNISRSVWYGSTVAGHAK